MRPETKSVCVCVCRERGREREMCVREKEREREGIFDPGVHVHILHRQVHFCYCKLHSVA